jgi:hypothetical protein
MFGKEAKESVAGIRARNVDGRYIGDVLRWEALVSRYGRTLI